MAFKHYNEDDEMVAAYAEKRASIEELGIRIGDEVERLSDIFNIVLLMSGTEAACRFMLAFREYRNNLPQL